MRRINIASPDFKYDPDDPPGFRAGMLRFGPLVGAEPAATVYPDSDKVAIWTGNRADDLMTTRSSSVDYWFGEVDLS